MSDYEFCKDKPKPKNHICAAALIVRDGKVLMGLREYEKGKPLWTFPGGRCDFGEKQEDGLMREVREEVGITDIVIKRFLGEKEGAYKRPDGVADLVSMYECITSQEPKLMEPDKFIEWRWIDPQQLPDNLIDLKDVDFIRKIL